MSKQELFEALVRAMDNYNKALEVGMSEFENYYNNRIEELYQEVENKGLTEEFEDYTYSLTWNIRWRILPAPHFKAQI